MSSERARVVRELAGFKLLKELGQGGMGKVFLARQASLDRLVALKVLPPELNADAEFVQRFDREAKAAALFQHPHVVAVYDQGRDAASGVRYIAFEYVDGGSLEHLLDARERLPEREALTIGRAVAMALEYAEDKDLVHRDVKPENILLTRAGVPKLADLGLAKQAGGAGTNVTQTGVVLGTPLYMAPEQALGEPDLDVRADLYALGLCLWRCLTGLVPFDEDRKGSSLQILSKHIHQDLPDVRTRAPDVSEGAAKVIGWLAARDRTRRYPSAGQAVHDLDRVLNGLTPIGPKDPGSDTTVLYGSPEAQALLNERASARRASGQHRRPSSSRLPAAAPAPSNRLPHPSVFVIALVLVGALGIGIGLALATAKRRGRKPPAPPAPTTDVPVASPNPAAEPEVAPPPAVTEPPSPPVTEPAPPPATEVAASTDAPPASPATETTPPTTEVDAPQEDPLVLVVARALDRFDLAIRADLGELPGRWRPLRAELASAEVEPAATAAVERMLRAGDAFVELAAARTPEERSTRREALGAALRAAETPATATAHRVERTLELLRGVLADLAVIDELQAEPEPLRRAELARSVRTEELRLVAHLVSAGCLMIDTGELGKGLRGDREAVRRGLTQLVDVDDLEAAVRVLKRTDEAGPGAALAHALLARGDGERSAFLEARVAVVATSMTGQSLGHARGLLVVPARPLGDDQQVELRIDGRPVTVTRDRLVFADGSSQRAPRWADQPAIVVEAGRRGPVLASLDAVTGEVVDVVKVDLPGRQRFVPSPELSYATTVGLEAVALLQPGARQRRGR